MQNSINLLAVPANIDLVASGVVIIIAAGIDVYRRLTLEPALARRTLERQMKQARAGTPPEATALAEDTTPAGTGRKN